ncbi:hypothetical protein B5S33_g3322 [[Candida] boidinii]|nr:hypothetical protein B5S33_g3322 [[Candida] boidinii]
MSELNEFKYYNIPGSTKTPATTVKEIYSCLIYYLCIHHEELNFHDNNENNIETTTNNNESNPSSTSSSSFSLFSKKGKKRQKSKYPYSFTIEAAIDILKDLNIQLKQLKSTIKISYNITNTNLSKKLIQIFLNSRLLHVPNDKTRIQLKKEILLQPSPKGLAIFTEFCEKYSLISNTTAPPATDKPGSTNTVDPSNENLKINNILSSNFNSMKLLIFERNLNNNSIVLSNYLKILLFLHFIGVPKQNIQNAKNDKIDESNLSFNFWSPNNKPDKLYLLSNSKSSTSQLNTNIQLTPIKLTFNFNSEIPTGVSTDGQDAFLNYLNSRKPRSNSYLNSVAIERDSYLVSLPSTAPSSASATSSASSHSSKSTSSSSSSSSLFLSSAEISPFFHIYFNNPDSDSAVQYYVSYKGVRMFKDKKIFLKSENESVTLPHCFTGKAAVQWLMDCTDILYINEAIRILQTFIESNYIKCINEADIKLILSKNRDEKFGNGNIGMGVKFYPFREAIYVLTSKGMELISSSNLSPLTPKKDDNMTTPTTITTHQQKKTQKILKNPFSDPQSPKTVKSDLSVNTESKEMEINQHHNPINPECDKIDNSNVNNNEIKKSTFKLTLKDILNEPGMKYLFKSYLSQNLSIENLELYDEIENFNKKMIILTKLLHLKEKNKSISSILTLLDINNNNSSEILIGSSKDLIRESLQNYDDFEVPPDKLNSNIIKLIDDCIWSVFNIYRLYLTNGVPLEVNIDQNLRDQLKKCIIKSKKQDFLKNLNSKKMGGSNNNSTDDITKHKISALKSTIKPLEDDTATSIISSSSNFSTSATATLTGVTGSGIGSQSSIPSVVPTTATDTKSLNLSSTISPSSNSGASKITAPAPIDLQLCESYNNNSNTVLTPTETIIGPNLKILFEALEILKKISSNLYFLMENDSLPNFLKISSKKLQKLSNF